jgi:hypothetical protein
MSKQNEIKIRDMGYLMDRDGGFNEIEMIEFINQIFLDGRREQARVDREAVDKLKLQALRIIPWRTDIPEALNEVFAALSQVAPEGK